MLSAGFFITLSMAIPMGSVIFERRPFKNIPLTARNCIHCEILNGSKSKRILNCPSPMYAWDSPVEVERVNAEERRSMEV